MCKCFQVTFCVYFCSVVVPNLETGDVDKLQVGDSLPVQQQSPPSSVHEIIPNVRLSHQPNNLQPLIGIDQHCGSLTTNNHIIEAQLIAARLAEPNPEELERFIAESTGNGDPNVVLIDKFKVQYRRVNIFRHQPRQWLNDESINFCMLMLQQRDNELCFVNQERKPSHFFNTFFYGKIDYYRRFLYI